MTRRLLLFLPFAACLHADSEKDVEALLASAIAGLSDGRPELFLEPFDRAMPDFEKLRTAIVGLTGQADVSCSFEVVHSEGDDESRTLTLDWILRIDGKGGNTGSTRRQQTVTCTIIKRAKKWRIVSFSPVELFTPPGA